MGLPCTAVVIDDYAPRRSSYVSFPVWIYWYNVTLEILSVWYIFGKTVVLIISLFETDHHSPENETPEATYLVSKLVSKSKYHVSAMLLSFDTKGVQFTSLAFTGLVEQDGLG